MLRGYNLLDDALRRQLMSQPDFNATVLAALNNGMTYTRAAKVFNTTRGVISGIADRAKDAGELVEHPPMPTPAEVQAVRVVDEDAPVVQVPITQCVYANSDGVYCHREPEPGQPYCKKHRGR